MPGQAGVVSVLAGVALAAVIGWFLRWRAERRERAEHLWAKRLAVEVIQTSEQFLAAAAVPAEAQASSLAGLLVGNSRYRAAVRGLTLGTSSAGVRATLSELEQARQQVLLAVVADDADLLRSAVRELDDAVEGFAAASSVMVRLA